MTHRLIRFISTALLLAFIGACQSPPATGPKHFPAHTAASTDQAVLDELTRITDQTLLALATYNYDQLPALLGQDPNHRAGPDIAHALLGPDYKQVHIIRWDAEKIEIEFTESSRRATTRTPITYRRHPNRNSNPGKFTLALQRNANGQWSAVLP